MYSSINEFPIFSKFRKFKKKKKIAYKNMRAYRDEKNVHYQQF